MRISGPGVKRIRHLGEVYRWKVSKNVGIKLLKTKSDDNSPLSFFNDYEYEYVSELLVQNLHKGDICVSPITWSNEVPINNMVVRICIDNALSSGWKPKKRTAYPFYVCDLIDTVDLPTSKAKTRLVKKTMDM